MTEALATPRVLPSPIGPVIPAVDVARNIGYSRSALTHAMSKNKALFNGLKVTMEIDTTRGPQHGICLNSEGVAQLLSVLSPSGSSKSELKDRLDAYRERVFGGRANPLVPGPDPLTESLRRNAERADILISGYGYTPELARKLAMQKVVDEVGEDAFIFRGPAMLPALPETTEPVPAAGFPDADPDFERYFSMQKVAEMCHCTRNEAVNILDKEGVIAYANGIWHLTRLGERFGKAFVTYPLAPHRMNPKTVIRYSPAAVNMVRGRLSSTQAALPTAKV